MWREHRPGIVVSLVIVVIGLASAFTVGPGSRNAAACPTPTGPSITGPSPQLCGGGCTPTTVTFTFYVLGSSQTYILFDYMEFASGQSGQFPVGCGESYYTSVWQIPSTETFWQWSTSAGGSFTNPNTNWTTYNAGSTGGIVYAILNDTSSAIPTELTQPGGYYVTGLSSTTSEVDAYFTVPALTYLPNAYGENQLAFVISLGGFTAPNGEEAWQLWFYINVSSSGPTYQGAF